MRSRYVNRWWLLNIPTSRVWRKQLRSAARHKRRSTISATFERLEERTLLTGIWLSSNALLASRANDGELSGVDEIEINVLNPQVPVTNSFRDGLNGYKGTRDTRIRGDLPTSNFGSSTKLELDGSPDQVSLIRWDTSTIPAASTVTAASITVNVVNSSIQDFEVYEALRSWDEDTANFEFAATGQRWQVPGAAGAADHAPDVLSALTSPSTGIITVDLNAKGVALVQKWITNPSRNHGIVIQDLNNNTSDDLDMSAREAIDVGPQLTVTYTPKPGSSGEPQFKVKHSPRLQLGNAALTGFSGSESDQVEVLWETIPAGTGNVDSFVVQYRAVGHSAWSNAGRIGTVVTGVEGRIIHSAVIHGLAYDSDYEYRVQHLRLGNPVATYEATFRTRLPANNPSPFTFVAYGDSAELASINGFRNVQNRINMIGPQLAILLGDNIYPEGTHEQSDARFDPLINPEAVKWNASHIDYPTLGNHEIRLESQGEPSEQLFSVPIPIKGVNSSAQPSASERPEHNYSFDYGNVHFVTFDSNSEDNDVRLNAQLNWVEQDLQASNAHWKVAFAHHPVAGVPDKPENPGDDYYQQVVPRLRAAGVDLLLVGHSHTYSRTYPLLGQTGGQATFVLDTDNSYLKGAGLVQVVSGVGGKDVRRGDYNQFPFVAAGFTSSTTPAAKYGFAQILVTPTQLTINYIAASDGRVLDSFRITDAAPNHPPLVVDDSYNVNEDGILIVPSSQGILFNDSDADSDPLTATLVNGPSHGSLTLNDAGSFNYTPHSNYNGVEQFTYRATDGLNSQMAAVSIKVDAVNDPPIAEDLITTTNKDVTVSITLRGGDVEGDALTYSVVSGPSSGILQGIAPNLTYKPNTAVVGTDRFTYQVSDGSSNSSVATATIMIVDPVPVTVSLRDGLNGYQGTRDTRLRGDQPTVTNGTSPKLELDGHPDHVSLVRWDTSGIPLGSTVTSASITFNVINTSVHQFEVYEASRPWDERAASFQLAATGKPWEVPGAAGPTDHLTEVLATLTSPALGMVTFNFNAKGVATVQKWISDASRNHGIVLQDLSDQSTDALNFSAREATGLGPMLTVTYTQGAPPKPNHTPVANNQTVSTAEDIAKSILLTASDADGDPLAFTVDSGPSHGTLSGLSPALTYTPNANFHGLDSFRFRVNDGLLDSAIATVSITVDAVNDPPVAKPFAVSTAKDVAASIALNGSDVDGDVLSYSIPFGPAAGNLTGTAPNLTYTPRAGFTGADSFTYQVHDGTASSAVATVAVNVTVSSNPVTLAFQNGVAPTVSYAGARDTKIRGDQSTANHGTSGKLEMDGNPDIATLLKWDISQIPAGSVVQSAFITINVVNTSTHIFNLYQLLRPWVESKATFNVYATGKNWQVAGAQGSKDRGSPVLGSVTAPNLGTITIQLNGAGVAVVQAWVNNSAPNHGLALQNFADASTDDLEFTSREGSSSQLRPKLTIAYLPPPSLSTSAFTISSQMTNPNNPYDVNYDYDSVVTSSDALIVINRLNGTEGEENQIGPDAFPDVSGDNVVSPSDILLIINYLNEQAMDAAESEASIIGASHWIAKPVVSLWESVDDLNVGGIVFEVSSQGAPSSQNVPRRINEKSELVPAHSKQASPTHTSFKHGRATVRQIEESCPTTATDAILLWDLESVLHEISEDLSIHAAEAAGERGRESL